MEGKCTTTPTTTVESLRKALEDLGLDTRGHKPELKKRLRKAKKKLAAQTENQQQQEERNKTRPSPLKCSSAGATSTDGQKQQEERKAQQNEESESTRDRDQTLKKQPFDYYLFFDVEATCEEGGSFEYPNEIIEFPIVLVDGRTFEIVDEFRSYVKPETNPVLSDYCIKLTGIDQETVDASPTFIEVLNSFQEFLAKHALFRKKSAVFVTDGPFDIRDFITKQCVHSSIERPSYFKLPWINIRKMFREFYGFKQGMNIAKMLETLNMTFDGRQHSGLDDARNLYRIAQKMRIDGCIFKTNMYWEKPKRRKRR